jgi:hypothetical protein
MEPDVEEVKPPESWAQSDDYLYGCDLYNHTYWWEAHEAWEGLWQQTNKAGGQGQFLQTLIQAGACHLKIDLAKPEGVSSLLASSRGHYKQVLQAVGEAPYMGLDHLRWFGQFVTYVEDQLRSADLRHDPERYPFIRLS